uniref:Uncharacterized protein MANES_09G189100 n=1 Tax=Rhizophora mucronata TaxID=61149 RepID=A0A2P2Q736_RHIMU
MAPEVVRCGDRGRPIAGVLFLTLSLTSASLIGIGSSKGSEDPTPAAWPHQFHAILFMNYSGILQKIDLWYDWSKGRNFNIIQHQLGKLWYDLEWNNGTSFFYTLDSDQECSSVQMEVGIIRPNWLEGAKYLGQRHVDGFLCNVWEKVDFIWYYEDVVTKRPVHWVFYTGREAHVMTFEVGAALEDEKWQAPFYCFHRKNGRNEGPAADASAATPMDRVWRLERFHGALNVF